MKKLSYALVLTSLFATGAAQATPFGFAADKNGTEFISQGYMGFNYGGESGTSTWVNDSVGVLSPTDGISKAPLGAIWSNHRSDFFMTSAVAGQKFNMGSLSLDNGTTSTVTIEGLVGGKVVDTWTGLVQNQSAYVNVTLNWTGIDELFLSSGHQSNVFVTNIDTAVANVPEPATVALIGLGLLGVAAGRRRKP